jgi:hypothetical protein
VRQIFTTKYETSLKYLTKLSDDVRQSSDYLENWHQRTCKDRNLDSSSIEAVRLQLSKKTDDVNEILSLIHGELFEYPGALKRDGLSVKSFAESVKAYWDIFPHGHTPNLKRNAPLKTKDLPNITDFFKLFEWLNNVVQISNDLSHETTDGREQTRLIDIEEEANNALREFNRVVLPFTKAFQKGFVNVARKEMTIATKETIDKYKRVLNAVKDTPWLLEDLGLTRETNRELKTAVKSQFIQNGFLNHDVEVFFGKINEAISNNSLKDAKKQVIEILESLKKRSKNFKKHLALAISYQIVEGLTIPQKIIKRTVEPSEQEDALGLFLTLKDFGIGFDGRNQNQNSCLHILKTWHKSLAQFLTLLDDSTSKTAVNLKNQTAQELLRVRFTAEGNDPYYDMGNFLIIDSLLSPDSADSRATEIIK